MSRFSSNSIRPVPLLLVGSLAVLCALCVQGQAAPGEDFIELGSLPRPEAQALMDDAFGALLRGEATPESDDDLLDRPDRRRLFLRVYYPGLAPIKGTGAGENLRRSLSEALLEVLSYPEWSQVKRLSHATIVLGVERSYFPVYPRISGIEPPAYDPLGHTLFIEVAAKRSAVTPTDYLSHGHTPSEEVQVAEKMLTAKPAKLHFVKTDVYVRLPLQGETVPLWRGHAPVGRIDAGGISRAADLAARYMMRSQTLDGSFPHIYWPLFDAPSRGSFDPEPQALAVFALAGLAARTGSEAYDAPLDKGVLRLSQGIVYPPDESKTFMCLPSARYAYATASAAALALVALDEYAALRQTNEYDWQIVKLAEFLSTLIQKNGAVIDVYYFDAEAAPAAVSNRSYPVEVIPALVRLYRRTSDERWLELAKKAAEFAVVDRAQIFPNIPLRRPGWLVMGLVDLSSLSKSQSNVYRNWSTLLLEDLLSRQFEPSEAPFQEFDGGFRQEGSMPLREGEGEATGEPDSCTTADALLALLYAQENWPEGFELPSKIRRAAIGAESFLLHEQFTEHDSFYLKDPLRCVGGIRQNWSNCEIRLETVAVAVNAFSRDRRLHESSGQQGHPDDR